MIQPERVAVIGTSGSGKTTIARALAAKLGAPHVEIDALHWEANWKEADKAVFRERVRQATSGERWVADGNYSKVRDIVWLRATHIVWLDYPFAQVMAQMIQRTFRRVIGQEELWHGNRERFATQFLSRDSLFLWVIQTHWKRQREYPLLFQRPENAHLQVIRLRSPQEARAWLAEIG